MSPCNAMGLRAVATLGLLLTTGAARAALVPALVDRISVDTAYATGISQATDIAFAGDGRAVITRKTGQVVIREANGAVIVQ